MKHIIQHLKIHNIVTIALAVFVGLSPLAEALAAETECPRMCCRQEAYRGIDSLASKPWVRLSVKPSCSGWNCNVAGRQRVDQPQLVMGIRDEGNAPVDVSGSAPEFADYRDAAFQNRAASAHRAPVRHTPVYLATLSLLC